VNAQEAGHFPGCHPEDARDDREADPATVGQPVENCWHCGTPTPRGCTCDDCRDAADYIPPSAIYDCPLCRRWWAWMTGLNITTITFGADDSKPEEG
jgi:hypothetical protein